MQKKCFVASTGFHLLLLVILFVGPAFLSSRDKNDNLPVLEFIPMITTDKPFSGGGNPNANPPPVPAPQQPQTQVAPSAPKPPPQVEKIEKVEPVKQSQPTKTEPQALETKPENKPRKIQVNTTLTTRSKVQSTQTKSPVKTDSNNSDNRSKDFSDAAKRIARGTAPSTEIEPIGLGGGGPTYANYATLVITRYEQAWMLPDDLEETQARVKVSVTIARDGTVLSARIIEPSGNAALDRSVQAALDRVTFIAPFPDGAKEEQRSYKFNFKPKARQLLG